MPLKENVTFSNSSANLNSTTEDEYDHVGAMHFIIATILVYSTLGVFCTLVVRIKRSQGTRSYSKNTQDEDIAKYLKQEKYLKQDGFKMKLAFECEKTKELLSEIDGRVRLLEVQRAVTCQDFSTAKCQDFSPKKQKSRKKKRRKSRLDSLVGKMGFSLLYVPDVETLRCEEIEMEENGVVTCSVSSSITNTPSQSEATTPVQNSSILLDQKYSFRDDYSHTICLSRSSSYASLNETETHVDIPFEAYMDADGPALGH